MFFALCFTPALYFGKELFEVVAKPLLMQLPVNSQMIATQVFSTFTVPLKLSLFLSLLITIPFCFTQIWGFVAPGLFKSERKTFLPLLLFSVLLFYSGAAFAYFIVCPMALSFFIKMLPQSVAMMTDISNYLSFILTLTLSFGLAFQVPIIVYFVTKMGLVSVENLRKSRRYIIIAAFTLGMLLTPPDVLSQVMLAIPLWALFELGLWLSAKNIKT
jgi:sec-independent protein translocase protein TatC